jgi:hypothetical protein
LYGTLRGIMCRSLVTESPTGHATEGLHDLDLIWRKARNGQCLGKRSGPKLPVQLL